MRQVLAASIVVLSFASVTAAQSWRELYDRGEYEKAAALLHPLVLVQYQGTEVVFPDVDATETLARLYLEGKGVAQDRVIACSFANLASSSAISRYHTEHHPVMARIVRLQASTCGTLSADEARESGQMTGCPKYGPDPQTFALDVDHSVEVSRRGLRIEHRGKQHVAELPSFGCSQRVALVRYTRVDPRGADAPLPARHLIELFAWVAAPPSAPGQQVLMWQLVEILGASAEWRAPEQIAQQAGSPWMTTAVPGEVANITFDMGRTGEVRWRFLAADLRGELPQLPEIEEHESAPRLPVTGMAHVDVSVRDWSGAPLAGATVKLTGVISREVTTAETGTATFENLPDGRYDVVASAKGLASSVPRVLDLSGPDVTALALTLKPYAPTGTSTIACGGFDPRSIAAMGDGADFVLHVKIEDQHTSELARPGDYPRTELATFNQARVLRSFKSAALAQPLGSTLSIRQGGGRIDRGDYIEHHSFNRLGPLNVGDEYVLFLTTAPDGMLWIHGSEKGAFRIRNGGVEPLGSGGAAEAWKGRAARAFFEALQTRLNRQSVSGRR